MRAMGAAGAAHILLQPFSQNSHTPTVAKEFQIGHYDPTEADLEHFWNSCGEGFLGERLYIHASPGFRSPPRPTGRSGGCGSLDGRNTALCTAGARLSRRPANSVLGWCRPWQGDGRGLAGTPTDPLLVGTPCASRPYPRARRERETP